MSARTRRKGNPRALLVGAHVGAATVETSMELPQKVTDRPSPPYGSRTGYLPPRYKDTHSVGSMHTDVHSSVIDKSQIMAAAQVPADSQMDKDAVCVHNSAIKKNIFPLATTWTDLEYNAT